MQKLFEEAEKKMDKTIDALMSEYSRIRAGRANPSILDKILVDYYGTPTPINQMAAVSVVEARTLAIQPWDASTLKKIERAIQISDIGINPQNEGKVIRLNFPPLTQERRIDLVRDIKKYAEDSKVSIRGTRRDILEKIKKMKKNSEITEDDFKDAEDRLQKKTNSFTDKIDNLAKEKEKEIMEI